jgi:single-stranded-DNA-specific exonuclease
MILPRWYLSRSPDPGQVEALTTALSIPAPLAALLVQRGYDSAGDARAFLRPVLDDLTDPLGWAGMRDAVTLVAEAVRRGDAILIHGDYDVDGQCAAALLTRLLRAGARTPMPSCRIACATATTSRRGAWAGGEPRRPSHHRVIAASRQSSPCARRAEAGIEVIVTDHHLPGDALPRPTPSSIPDDPIAPRRTEPVRRGRGVQAGAGPWRPCSVCRSTCRGTCSITSPWRRWRTWCRSRAKNRILVRHGLKLLADSRWVGLGRSVEAADSPDSHCAPATSLHSRPRLNAAGRMAPPPTVWGCC